MNPSKPSCLKQEAIQKFLDDQLPEEDEQLTQSHLAKCSECQSQLEQLVTRGYGWGDLQENLKDFPQQESTDIPREATSLDPLDLANLLAPTDDPERLGRLGRYEICGMIGRGSAGVVFKGHDSTLNRFVAIKMLAPGLAFMGTSRKRFEREARAIASVNHPNVIEVHGVDEFRDRPYIVMQYFPDGSLQNRIDREGWMTTTEVCRIGLQIARGLCEAHQQGIVHRDIKPANILLENGTERAVVSDFGLARVADEVTMTRSGSISGTPQYMSPEQARGQVLDTRSDLFSLGCVMYAACTGRSPFDGKTLMGVMNNVCESDPKQIRNLNPEIADWLADFITKMLSKKREDRFQLAEEIDEILTAELAYLRMPNGMKQPARDWRKTITAKGPKGLWVAVGLIGTLLCLAGFAFASTGWPFGATPDQRPSSSGDVGTANAPNQYGFVPTRQEATAVRAKAAFDLAYQTHLEELGLRGDMDKSIEAHQQALELGYDPARSAFLLASACAVERKKETAFEWLETARRFGYHDYESAESQSELSRLKSDPRFPAFINDLQELKKKHSEIDKAYFVDIDFKRAEHLCRAWLKECPKDEQAIMLLGAALLEQGKLEESVPWHEKTRHSVRFANFGVYNLGCVAAQQGETDLAFNYLNYSFEVGFSDDNHLENDHHLIPLRDDPRFPKLLAKMREE